MVILYFVDGLRYSLVEKYMPYLNGFYKRQLKSEFGYSCACHATMYTGEYPERHNTWFVWKKGDNSPYAFVNKIPLLKFFNNIFLKVVISKISRKLHQNSSFSGIPMLVNLPLRYWGLFEPCEDVLWTNAKYMPGHNTLFKLLEEYEMNYELIGIDKRSRFIEAAESLVIVDRQLYYIFLGELDDYLHKYGSESDIVKDFLKRLDNLIKKQHKMAQMLDNDCNVICYSDHGHITVIEKVDINIFFRMKSLNVNQFIHLLESTFVRFWPRDSKERKQIQSILQEMEKQEYGFVLTKTIMEKYHLDFESSEHGEIIFHLKAPRIFINTIWGFGKTIVSMHGYEPHLVDNLGVFASSSPIINSEYVQLVDILPTICKLVGIPDNNWIGKTLL